VTVSRPAWRRAASASLVVVALAATGGLTAACGGNDASASIRPTKVPDGLVPDIVQGGAFQFFESQLPQVKDAFDKAGDHSLAADGRLWELRKGDRLVGSLQLTTLMPDVDLTKAEHRDSILTQLLPTGRDELLVDEVNVWTTTSNNKTIYLWFGRDMYALMTLKGGSEDNLDPEVVLGDVISQNVSSSSWKPLFIDDEDADL
jgi:hypothetical protein